MSIFDTLFGKFKNTVGNYTQFKFMNYTPTFSDFGTRMFDSDTVRAAVDSIASNAAKLKPVHVRIVGGQVQQLSDPRINYAISVRPNALMSAYDFWYQMFAQREIKNNSFAIINYDREGNLSLYPISYSSIFAVEQDGVLFMRFMLNSGEQLTVDYDELIHLRRHFYDHDVFGANNKAILPTLELLNTINEGLGNAIKSTAYLRGILQFTQTMLKPEDVKKQRDDFITDYLDMSNNGGIAALDSKAEYKELKGEPKFVNPVQMKYIKDNVYDYYNINQNIIQGNYTENQWNAFYESKLEAIGLQAALECTYKIFTKGQLGHGNQIIFEANRLQYASNSTKIELLNKLIPLGLLSQNEGREIFNLAPLPDGDRRFISLNYVDTDIINQYQLDKVKGGEGDDTSTDDQQDD